MYIHLHETLTSQETLEAKQAFKRFAVSHDVTIKHYHCDDDYFADKDFLRAFKPSNQTITFCGDGAHYQNGVAEKRIRDITEGARTTLLHGPNQ